MPSINESSEFDRCWRTIETIGAPKSHGTPALF
jgi:hypothetical protein